MSLIYKASEVISQVQLTGDRKELVDAFDKARSYLQEAKRASEKINDQDLISEINKQLKILN